MMGDLFQPAHLLVLLIVFSVFFLIPGILYLLTLQNALSKCDPSVRQMEPGMVWLLLIPLFNFIWIFFVVMGIGKSLGAELRRRGISSQEPYPAQSVGMAMAICKCCCIIPLLNLLAGLAYVVLWIMYWIKVADFSRMLDQPQAFIAPPHA
jgi:hypothetical protein